MYQVPVVLIIVIARVIVRMAKARSGKAPPITWPEPRRLFWRIVGIVGAVVALPLGLVVIGALINRPSPATLATMLAVIGAVGGGALAFAAPWMLLHPLARLGHFRCVYYAAQLSPLFLASEGMRGGAVLLSALGLAHAPSSTAAERAFLGRRLANEKVGGAAYGAALAMWHALEARAAREVGETRRAMELEDIALAIFGTLAYMSAQACPPPVQRVAEEYLVLASARRGQWGAIEAATNFFPAGRRSLAGRAVTAFVNEKLKGKAREQADEEVLRELGSPIVDRLFERQPFAAPRDAVEASARAGLAFATLVRCEYVAPRMVLAMLATYDVLLDPAFGDTVFSSEVRDDPELVSGVQESVAESIAEVLTYASAPLFALSRFGPISARVHARVEAVLFEDMIRSLKRFDERRAGGTRLDARAEWMEASLLRAQYRRIHHTLGDAAVARVQQQFAFSYGNLGVDLSNKAPRRRPLAYAIFHMLQGEGVRTGNAESVGLQAKNMRITAGPR